MTSNKAISLLNMQLEKLNELDKDTHQAWKTQTSSYIKDIFGEDSEEYLFVKGFDFVSWYNDNSDKYQISQKSPQIKNHLENCIESLEHRGLVKAKNDKSYDKESWTKKYPLVFEIVKAIIILLVGYFFRVITEPTHSKVESKVAIQDSIRK